jgi:hypothetical protein
MCYKCFAARRWGRESAKAARSTLFFFWAKEGKTGTLRSATSRLSSLALRRLKKKKARHRLPAQGPRMLSETAAGGGLALANRKKATKAANRNKNLRYEYAPGLLDSSATRYALGLILAIHPSQKLEKPKKTLARGGFLGMGVMSSINFSRS